MKNLLLILMIGMVLFSMASVSAVEISHTPTTKTICENFKCSQIIYPGTQFVYEDKIWKNWDEAISLKDQGFEIVVLEDDPDYPLEIVDFNSTSIVVNLKKWSILNTEIPLKIWRGNETSSQLDFKNTYEKVLGTSETFNILDLGSKRRTFDFRIGDILEFGHNSTTIILQDPNTENFEDTYVVKGQPDLDKGSAESILINSQTSWTAYIYLKFNVASIPSRVSIQDANLSLYYWDAVDASPRDVYVHHVYNQSWVESITWNTDPCGDPFDDPTNCNLTYEENKSMDLVYGFKEFDISNMLTTGLANSQDNLSMVLRHLEPFGDQEWLRFNSKENATLPSRKPFLNITYKVLAPLSKVNVTLNSPTTGSLFSEAGKNFTANYSCYNCTINSFGFANATYNIWKEGSIFNTTLIEINGTSNYSTQYIDSFTIGSYEWNIYACGKNATSTLCTWEISNYTFKVGTTKLNERYSNNTYETRNETFSINVSLLAGTTLYDSQLYYDGTFYEAEEIDFGGGKYSITTTIDIPTIKNVSEVRTFNWVLTFPLGDSFVFQNLTSSNQNISKFHMGEYNATLKTRAINFSAFGEQNSTPLDPFDFYGTFYYWLGSGSVKKNFSLSNPGVANQTIAISHNFTYYTDSIIQYEKTSFVKRNYYLNNATITNATSDIKLFLLTSASSTTFILEVIDEAQFPVGDAYIYIQRYYPGTGIFEIVEMAITDDTGSTIGHFEKETEDYKFIIIKDGLIVYESDIQKIILGETPYTITFQIGEVLSTTWETFGDVANLIWSLTYDESLKMWTYTYVDTSGTTQYGRLHTWIEEGLGKTTICNINSTTSAATLICNVTDYEGTIYSAGYISRSPEFLVYMKSILIEGLKDVLGMEGLFFSFFILLLLALVGLWNPVVGIIMMILGMCFMTFIGLASFGAVTLWGIIFMGVIILWMLRS